MKKLRFAFVLLLCLGVFLCLCSSAYAEPAVINSGTCGADGDNLTWTLYDTGELVIDGTGAMADYDYDYYHGHTAPWNVNRLEISSVTIHNGVTSIGGYAFYNDTKLEEVSIPETVRTIGSSAFYNCTYLVNVTIPVGVTNIGHSAFYGCNRLTSVTIPEGVTGIGGSAFSGCSRLTSVTIPESVTIIEDSAFSGCSSLTSIHIISLEAWCGINFSSVFPALFNLYLNNVLVTELIIPDSVTSLGRYAFSGCSSLTSVTMPEGVTSLGRYAFSRCSSLRSVTIPDSVTRIRDYAFSGCSSLTSVTIPEGVTSVGDYAFSGCGQLKSVTIPGSLRIIGEYAFRNCTSLTDVYYGGSEAQWETISIGYSNEPLKNATIHYHSVRPNPDFILPSSLMRIESKAFTGGAFTYVYIPETVARIESGAFASCPKLAYAQFAGADTEIDGSAFDGVTDLTIIAPGGSTAEAFASAHGFDFMPAA